MIKLKVNWFEEQGWKEKYPLHYYSMVGNTNDIKLLVNKGVDPNMKLDRWYDPTPLSWAATFGQLKSVIELIRLGADPLIGPNKAGNTPKMDAKREKHRIIVKLFNK